MTPLWLPMSHAKAKRPSEHEPGSLLALIPSSRKAPVPCWALRFDFVAGGGTTTPCLYFVNGNPWNRATGVIVQCSDGHLDDRAVVGFSAPETKIRIDFNLASRILTQDVGYYEVGPFIAIGAFGMRLCGQDTFRADRAHVWIDCDQWINDPQSFQAAMNTSDAVSAYIPDWRVTAQLPDVDQSFSVDFANAEIVA